MANDRLNILFVSPLVIIHGIYDVSNEINAHFSRLYAYNLSSEQSSPAFDVGRDFL